MPFLFLLVILLEFAIPLGVVIFCLASLFSAVKTAKAKRTAKAVGFSLPFASVVFGVAVFVVWFQA